MRLPRCTVTSDKRLTNLEIDAHHQMASFCPLEGSDK